MKVTLKSTSRRDLAHKQIKLDLQKKELPFGEETLSYPSINFLEILNVESELRVFLKIKQVRQVINLDFGTVGNIKIPRGEPLKSFTDHTQQLSIDVSLIDPISNKIKASTKKAIKILPDDPQEGESPIAVRFGDTGSRLWKLEEINEYEKPIVTFSKKIESQRKTQTNPVILSSIFPSILEKLLGFIWETDSQESDEMWINYFKRTSARLGIDWLDSDNDKNDIESKEEWIDLYIEEWMRLNQEITTDKAIEEINLIPEVLNEV